MVTGSVIIVTHNSASHVEASLRALQEYSTWERIVIDNASDDETIERVRRVDRAAQIISNDKNIGFGAAANRAASRARGKVLLFLNPDAVAQAGSLDSLASALEEESVGAAGGALVRPSGEIDVGFVARRLPTLSTILAEVLLLNRLWSRNPWNRSYRCLDLNYRLPQEIEQPAGACLAVKRRAWESVGGFDEQFFPVWFEDVDFCRRLRAQGWKIVYCPETVFVHAGGHSVSQLPFRDRQLFWYRNLLRYFRKHHTPQAVAALRIGMILGLGLRFMAALLGFGPQSVGYGEAMRGYAWVMWRCGLRAQ